MSSLDKYYILYVIEDGGLKEIKGKQSRKVEINKSSTLKKPLPTPIASVSIKPGIFLEVVSKLKKRNENVSIPIYG